MSKPNNTNTTQPSYIPPSPDPRFVETPSSILLARGFATSQTSNRRRKRSSSKSLDRSEDWRDQRIPYTAVESPPQSTPNDKELIELEQETAAPWVTGKKAINQAARRGKSKRTREQLEEDEILQEVLEEEAAIARLTEAAKNQELVAGQASEFDSLSARHQIRKKIREDFEEVEGVGNERGQGEEEEEEREEEEEEEEEEGEEYVEEKEQKAVRLKEKRPGKGSPTKKKKFRLDANEVPEEKDRLFNWSSDNEEEIDVLRKPKEEMKSKVISIGEETAKAVAKLMKMIPKGLKEEAKIVRRDLAEAVEGK
ncbi:hypothetical protein KEM48_012515 [Puccinia striiformis f. sp. tritici PST-130]|nr:hypothetical protein KEM48_012515 [Puccinia striiformis f. sp. tritici PST-130]